MADDPVRKGKIGRMPVAIRNEVNRRLFENEGGSKILTWLHEQPDALRILDEYFAEEPVTAQNLSEWRKGGYQDWLRRRDQVDRLKDLSEFALKLGEAAGGSIADGSAAIAGGRIMNMMESADDEDMSGLVKSLFLIRAGDQEKVKLDIRKKVLSQRDEVIDLSKKKFQRQTCELYLKWYDDERAKKVVESRASNSEKLEQLGKVMFGEDW
jgi:hypothetical protein